MNKRALSVFVACFSCTVLLFQSAKGAAGDIDSLDAQIGAGQNLPIVWAMASQLDGKIIVGGFFQTVRGVVRTNLARLNADGTLDPGFDPRPNNLVKMAAVQADGKVLLSGSFTTLQPNGGAIYNRGNIVRLNADGTVDTSFDPRPAGRLFFMALQPDGKVIIGGNFLTLQPNGGAFYTNSYVARLNSDGTVDTSFDPRPNGSIYAVAVQPDGKLLLSGGFSTLQPNGGPIYNRVSVARLNTDGTLDTAFDPRPDTPFDIVMLQSDGKLLVSGPFLSFKPNNGAFVGRRHLARLNSDGTVDAGFNPSPSDFIESLQLQADGKIVCGGIFIFIAGSEYQNFARLNSNGTLDASFDPNPYNYVHGVSLQADGMVQLGGEFPALQPNGSGPVIARQAFARVLNDPASQSLGASTNGVKVTWTRSGSAPEVNYATFESSTNNGATWTFLGHGTRVAGTSDWELTGLSLSGSGKLRARSRTAGGQFNCSSSPIEFVAGFHAGLAAEINVFTGTAPPADQRTNNVGTNVFAATQAGDLSAPQNFTIKNVGTTNLTGLALTLTGANPGDFISTALTTNTLLPGQTMTFSVTFYPSTNGVRNAAASIASNDNADNPFVIHLSGIGLAPEIAVFNGPVAPANARTDNVGTNVFATTLLGSSSAAQTFTIQNIGNLNLTGLGVSLTGDHVGDFVLGALGTNSLAPNATTTFTVSFRPVATGERKAAVSIASNDGNENPFRINLSGVGITPRMTVLGNNVSITNNSTPSLANHTDFGSVPFSTALVRTFTITNSGTATLTLGSVTITGAGAPQYKVTTQPATTVAANGSTTFQVSFSPGGFGLSSASLGFTSSDPAAPSFNFGVQATGIPSSDANLATLTLSRGTLAPAFAATTTNYMAGVAFSDTNLTVTATRSQTNATWHLQFNGGSYIPIISGTLSSQLALNVGTNIINVSVTAQDGTTVKHYTVSVIRSALGAADLDPLDLALTGNVNLIVVAIAVQPDGKTIIAGIFDSVLGVARTNIARLNADGTLDLSFDPNPNADVGNVVVQADGKVLIGGSFSALRPNGAASTTTRRFLARLNSDGTVDPGFDPSPNTYVDGMAVQPDGKVLLCGRFTSLQPNGGAVTNRNRIARLNADGSLDAGFDPNANNTVWSLALQPDGKVLCGGLFTSLQPNGGAVTNRNRIARLNADGTLDFGFDPNANNQVWSLALQPDGKLLLGGSFTALQPNGAALATARNWIARINSDGTLDPGFDPRPNNGITCLALQADGQVLAGGLFGSFQPYGSNVVARSVVARLKPDGTVDAAFNPNPNAGGFVYGVALQADGKVLLGGVFSTLQPNGAASPVTRLRFARLLNDPATQSLTATNTSEVHWTRGGSSPEISQVSFELSTNGGASWTMLGHGLRVGTTADWQLQGLALPTSGLLRARGRATSDGYIGSSSGAIESVSNFSIGVPVVSPVINPQSLKILGDGAFQFSFSNANNLAFQVLAAINVNQPLSNWTVLGTGTNLGGGLYQFNDPQATNFPTRFYQLRFP